MKKLLALILCIGMIGILQVPVFAGTTEFVMEDISLTEYNGKSASVKVPVGTLVIGEYAFIDNSAIKSINIPATTMAVNGNAFYNCKNLTKITVDAKNKYFTSIDGVLYSKDKKTLVAYPTGKTGAVKIPSTVISFSDGAFSGCLGFTDITIPKGVVKIGDAEAINNISNVFIGCKNLKAINVNTSNKVYASSNGMLMNKQKNVLLAVPNALDKVTVPMNVTEIGWYAFSGNDKIVTINVHSKLKKINNGAFTNCKNLEKITVHSKNTAYAAVNGVLYTKDKQTLVAFPSKKAVSFAVPKNVLMIDSYAFADCSELEAVTIPTTVTSIGVSAFANCTALKSIIIPKSVTEIADDAFYGCKGLKTITLPKLLADESIVENLGNTKIIYK